MHGSRHRLYAITLAKFHRENMRVLSRPVAFCTGCNCFQIGDPHVQWAGFDVTWHRWGSCENPTEPPSVEWEQSLFRNPQPPAFCLLAFKFHLPWPVRLLLLFICKANTETCSSSPESGQASLPTSVLRRWCGKISARNSRHLSRQFLVTWLTPVSWAIPLL